MFPQESPNQSDQTLVQSILEPLLDDFQYWFGETQALLDSPRADCLDDADRAELAKQLDNAKQEVSTARTLMLATEGNAGVDVAVVGQWHQLVNKCWKTSRYVRQHSQSDR
jgi:hypothetical protein